MERGRERGREREQKSARSWIDLIPPFLFSPSGYRFSDKLFGPPFSKRISLGNFQRRDTIDPFSTARFDSSTDGQLAGNSMDAREEEGSLSLFFIDFAKICRVEGARLVRNSARCKRPVPPCLLHPAKIETRERERESVGSSRVCELTQPRDSSPLVLDNDRIPVNGYLVRICELSRRRIDGIAVETVQGL